MGIDVLFSDGARSTIIRAPDGTVTEVEDTGRGRLSTYIASNGFLESAYFEDTEPADRFTYTFPVTEHVPLTPWASQQGEQITTDASGAEINRILFKWMTRGVREEEIDRCTYTVIPLETYYYEPSETSMVEFLWLPDIGIALNTGYSDTYGATPRMPLSLKPVEK